MPKERKDEVFKSYLIPYNFIDESKMFGGMVKTRNFVEGCICGAIASIPVFIVPYIGLKARIIMFIVLVMPALVFGIIGINGDPISKFILYYIKFRKAKRIVSFNNRVKLHERGDVDALGEQELPRDKLLKLLNNLGARREKAEENEINDAEDFIFDDDLEEIKKKEEETRRMLKETSKQNKTQPKHHDKAEKMANEEMLNNITDNNASQIDDIDDDGYENIPTLDEVLSSKPDEIDDFSDLIENTEVTNGESIDAVAVFDENENILVPQDNDEESDILILDGDIIGDYEDFQMTEVKPINSENDVKSNNDVQINENEQNNSSAQSDDNAIQINTQPPTKKNIALPWTCKNCGTKNLGGKFCPECGSPKQ